ncbi:MAG: hypothetical protein Tsb0010_09810 [Parvularculaceae bacterium]
MADRSALIIAAFFAAAAGWAAAAYLAAGRRGGDAPQAEERHAERSAAAVMEGAAPGANAGAAAAAIEEGGAGAAAGLSPQPACQIVSGARAQRAPCAEIAPGWPPEIAYGLPYDALKPLEFSTVAAARAVFDPEDAYSGLPRDEGYALVDAYCTACHSLQIVMQQRYARAGWDRRLDWMVETQGMAAMPPEDRAIILDYLARHF